MRNELINLLISVSKESEILLNTLTENYKKSNEKSKGTNQIEWVKLMNNYKNMAEEIILKELIFV